MLLKRQRVANTMRKMATLQIVSQFDSSQTVITLVNPLPQTP